ncbi:MAG: IS66 family insertion sequence element accessory protein TnpB [Maritimibacter sp.]|nr:IS66 family insertion sequence element accessory protein TnpB [Maritimibacter sp.]
MKLLWHDRVGMLLYAKRLEAGKFIVPLSPMQESPAGQHVSHSGESVQISAGRSLSASSIATKTKSAWIAPGS